MASPAMYPHRRRSLAGPIVLITIGILFLLKNLGMPIPLFRLFAEWWPLLLIVVGLVKLVEYYMAKREESYAPPLGGGTVALLIFIIIIGLGVTAAYKVRQNVNWGEVRDEVQLDDDFMGLFGNNYTYDQEVAKDLPDNSAVKIVSDRGSIAVSTWTEKKIRVVVHKRIFASKQEEAANINNGTTPQVEINGTGVTVNANTQGAGPKGVVSDMEVFLPANVPVEISCRRGDINVNGREADVKVSSSRGDFIADQIKGNINASLRKGSLRASNITGNITVGDGRLDDLVAMDVNGSVTVNGDVFGEVKLSKVSKGVSFHSSRTDLEMARLDGELDMDRGDMRATNFTGPTNLTVRSKDVSLEGVSGELRVQGEIGDVTVQLADKLPLGNVEINTNKGDIRVTVPTKANFQLDANTRRGSFNSEFPEFPNADTDRSPTVVRGSVGKGNSKIVLSTDIGDIDIRKATM